MKLLYRIKSSSPYAILSLIAANALPVYFAVSEGITPAGLVLLYWLETWVVVLYTVLKIKKSAGPITEAETNLMRVQFLYKYQSPEHKARGEVTRESMIRVTVLQWIVVSGVYGALLFGFLIPQVFERGGEYAARVFAPFSIAGFGLWLASSMFGLGLSHGVSFYFNFLGKKEFLNTSPARQSFALGERLIGLQLLLMFSGFLFAKFSDFGSLGSFGAILGIAMVKLISDVAAHSREHMINQTLGAIETNPGIFGKGGVFKFAIRGGKKN